MSAALDYMLDRLRFGPALEICHGLAQQTVRDDASARTARSALLLWRAVADRAGAGQRERAPLSRGGRRIGSLGRPGGVQAAEAGDRGHPAAARQSASRHA